MNQEEQYCHIALYIFQVRYKEYVPSQLTM